MAIDFNFLRKVEGFETKAYVPQDDNGVIENSGVTIGSGIDLGQWTRKQLASMGVPSAILDKLEPYLGKKKGKALEILAQQPLELSPEETEILTNRVKRGYADKIKKWYNKNNTAGNDWSDLTDRQQTSITSVAFQYGVGSKNTPKFNKKVLNNDWQGVVKELRNFGDRYDTRRHMELQYLVGADVDGILGPKTEAATERYLNTQDMMTPDPVAPQPEYEPELSQSLSASYIDELVEMVKQRLEPQQGASEAPSKARIEEGEAKLERTANEALLEAEAEAAEESVEFSPTANAVIDYVVGSYEDTAPTEERVEAEFSPFEEQLIQFASGTKETEEPVYVEEESNEGQDLIRTIF